MSWWQLGEGSGYRGSELELHRISCPFCSEAGNFSVEHHAEKRRANTTKKLNFETLRCENCYGYVMCLWSASERSWGGLYDYKVLPWLLRPERHPEEWPEAVGRYWVQARRSIADENWDAAAVMARSALQTAARDSGAVGRNLREEIDNLAERGLLPPLMRDWAHELRELGNEAAHPGPSSAGTDPADARDIVTYLDYFLEYSYSLPAKIEEYRKRREVPGADN